MPAEPFLDLDTIDLTKLVISREKIYERLPHRHEMMQLDGIVHFNVEERIGVALREIRGDEFWVRGHVPGRPLFPGVLMLESAAQMASYLAVEVYPYKGFLGFGGLDQVKFRAAVEPPATMYIIQKLVDVRARRVVCDSQGIVNGKLTFEARITGMII